MPAIDHFVTGPDVLRTGQAGAQQVLMDATNSVMLRAVGKTLRLLPPGTRGKGRLARALLSKKMRNQPVLTFDRDQNRMAVPNLLEPVGLALFIDGVYEPDVMQFLRENARSGSAVVDVGANIGAFTIPLAKFLNGSGHVVSVEASPSVFPVLKGNVERNQLGNVILVPCAASTGEQSRIPFYEAPADHFGMGSSAPQFGTAPIEIQARPLDGILRASGLSDVSVVKVDVEGYEAHVFLGAQALLKSSNRPRIVFEFCDWAEARAFPGRQGWAQEILMNHGYRLWHIADFMANRKRLDAPVREGCTSIVAIPGD